MRHPARDIHVKRQNWRLGLPGGPARPEHIAYIIIIAGQLFAKSSRSRAPACLHARQRAPRLGNLLEVSIPASLEEHQIRRSWKAKSANPLIPSSRGLPIIRSLPGAEGPPSPLRAFNRARRPLQRMLCRIEAQESQGNQKDRQLVGSAAFVRAAEAAIMPGPPGAYS